MREKTSEQNGDSMMADLKPKKNGNQTVFRRLTNVSAERPLNI